MYGSIFPLVFAFVHFFLQSWVSTISLSLLSTWYYTWNVSIWYDLFSTNRFRSSIVHCILGALSGTHIGCQKVAIERLLSSKYCGWYMLTITCMLLHDTCTSHICNTHVTVNIHEGCMVCAGCSMHKVSQCHASTACTMHF